MHFSFHEATIKLIMSCICTKKITILHNGTPSSWITPCRGIRQGILSHYIFSYCVWNSYPLAIKKNIGPTNENPLKFGRSEPSVSHYLFTDDMILFFSCEQGFIEAVNEVVSDFSLSSGLNISLQKSRIRFSKNVSQERMNEISIFLSIPKTLDL